MTSTICRIGLLLLIASASVQAQSVHLCSVDGAAGLALESARWQVRPFQIERFALVVDGTQLRMRGSAFACQSRNSTAAGGDYLDCRDDAGDQVLFSEATRRGAWSRIAGGLSISTRPETPYVAVFRCEAG